MNKMKYVSSGLIFQILLFCALPLSGLVAATNQYTEMAHTSPWWGIRVLS
jgi:hypothetical protein